MNVTEIVILAVALLAVIYIPILIIIERMDRKYDDTFRMISNYLGKHERELNALQRDVDDGK